MSIGPSSRPSIPLWLAGTVSLCLLAILIINGFAVRRYPSPSCDEVSVGSIATSFIEQGQFGWSAFTQGDYVDRDISLFRQGRIYTFGLIALFKLFGVSLTVARFYSLFGGLAAAILLFLVGRRFYSIRVGLLAALIFSTSIVTFISIHLLRPDIWLSAFNLLTILAVYKAISSDKLRWSFCSALLAVAAFDIHGHGLGTILAALVVVGYEAGWRQKQWNKLASMIGGLILGAVIWMALHLWPSPQAAYVQINEVLKFTLLESGASQEASGLTKNILTMGQFLITAYWGTGRWLGLLEALLTVAGIAGILKRRAYADRFLLIWVATSFTVFAVIFSQRFVNYFVLWSPLLILMGVSAIDSLLTHIMARFQQPRLISPVVSIGAFVLIAANLIGSLFLIRNFYNNNFDDLGNAIENSIPRDTRVIADPNWWWVLRHDRVFITDEYFLYPMPPFNPPPATIQDGITYLRPDYILIDSATSCINQDGPGHAELLNYAKENCTLVTQLDGAWVNNPEQSTTLLGQTTSVYRCTRP